VLDSDGQLNVIFNLDKFWSRERAGKKETFAENYQEEWLVLRRSDVTLLPVRGEGPKTA
jgi:hypothetical protein